MSVTTLTRRESYDTVIGQLGEKQKLVFEELLHHANGATAKELAVILHRDNKVTSPERNSVHPRLNEMVAMDMVKVIGKKSCTYTGRKVAVYKCN